MNKTEFAAALNWNEKNVGPRLNALGLLAVCTRCGGSGHYSYCQQWGSTCFKCAGSGKQLPARLTGKLLALVSERVAAGGLDEYLMKCKRIAEAKRALPALVAEARAVYMVIGQAYTDLDRQSLSAQDICESRTFAFQSKNNDLFYGRNCKGGPDIHPLAIGVTEVKRMAERGEVAADWAAERIRTLTGQLRDLVAEFETSRAVAA